MPITPMPADTFNVNTHQISQNWGVLCALSRWTLCCEIIVLVSLGGVQPSGFHPSGTTRYAKAPIIMKTKYITPITANVFHTPTSVGVLK